MPQEAPKRPIWDHKSMHWSKKDAKYCERYDPEKDVARYYEKVQKLNHPLPQKRSFRHDETYVFQEAPFLEKDQNLTYT